MEAFSEDERKCLSCGIGIVTISMDLKRLEAERIFSEYDYALTMGLMRYAKGKVAEETAICDRCGYKKAIVVIQEYDGILPSGIRYPEREWTKVKGFFCPKCNDLWGWTPTQIGLFSQIFRK